MLINVRTEKVLNGVINAKITKDMNYTDTLTFKIPLDEEVNVEDIIQVTSEKIKEKYRVREVVIKQDYKDVFCKHVFFDCEKVVIDNFSNQGRDNNLQSLVRFLNDKLNGKFFSGNSFNFKSDSLTSGILEFAQATTLYDVIFKEKGILDIFSCELHYHDWEVTFIDNLPSRNTEILFHENKNITDLSNLIEAKDLVTKLYVTSTYKENKNKIIDINNSLNGKEITPPTETINSVVKEFNLPESEIKNWLDWYLAPENGVQRPPTAIEIRLRNAIPPLLHHGMEEIVDLRNRVSTLKQLYPEVNTNISKDEKDNEYNDLINGYYIDLMELDPNITNDKYISIVEEIARLKLVMKRFKHKEPLNLYKKHKKDVSYYRDKFEEKEQKILENQRKSDEERLQRRKEYEEYYNRPKRKRTRAEIHADHLAYLEKKDELREQKREEAKAKRLKNFQELQRMRASKNENEKETKKELKFNYIYTSPLISKYPRVLEGIVNIESDEIVTLDGLISYCEEHFFTETDRRDVPKTTYNFKPVVDEYNVNLKDIALVIYKKINTRKIVSCIKFEYDPQNNKYYTTEFGDWQKATLKGNSVDEKISQSKETITSQIMDSVERMYYEDYLKKAEYERELFDSEFNSQFENIENNITEAIENNLKEVEDLKIEINQKIENNKTEISTEVAAAKKEALEHSKAYTDNINATIRNEVNTIQNNIVSFDSRLNDNIDKIKDFRIVMSEYDDALPVLQDMVTTANTKIDNANTKIDNAKNELSSQINNLNEWKITATGNIAKIGNIENTVNTSIARLNTVENTARESTQKIQELLQYKNNDNQRKEELKSYFESKTAEKLVTERNNIIRLVDNRGYVTTTSVNNIVNEKANEFSRQISSVSKKIESLKIDDTNLLTNSRGRFTPNEKQNNFPFDNYEVYRNSKIYMENGVTYTLTAKSDGEITDYHNYNVESDRVVLWLTDLEKNQHYIISDTNTSKKGTTFLWDKPSGEYFLRVNSYKRTSLHNVWEVKIEKGTNSTKWTPAPDDLGEVISSINDLKQTNEATINKIASIEQSANSSIQRLNNIENTARGTVQRIQSLEEYKNSNNEREQSLKTYIENKTAEQLTTQRTNILSIFDAKGYVNTETVNNIVNEKANQFSREISIINTKIADLKVGGRNLLKGTKDFSGEWDLSSWLDANETYQNLKVKRTDRGWNGINQNVFVEKGDVLTFSFYAKATSQIDVKLATLYSGSAVFKPPLAEIKGQETVYKTVSTDWARYDRLITVTKSGSLQCRVEYDGEWIGQGIWLFICGLKLEKGNIPTDWIQAPEDNETYANSKIEQKANEINDRVTNVEQNTVKYQDININTDNIQIGSSKIIDGNKLASLITVSPSAVSTITDKFIITSNNENLVDIDKRNVIISNTRDTLLSREFTDDLINGEEFLIKGRFRRTINGTNPDFKFMVFVWFYDGERDFPRKPILLNNGIPLKNKGINELVDVEYTFKLELPNNKKIVKWSIALQQEEWNNFSTWEVLDLVVQRKKDAKLIVDGSITASKIAANSITAAHLQSDIIDARHIKSRVITGDLIDVGTIKAENIAIGTITAREIAGETITGAEIRSGAIDTKHLKANSVEADQLWVTEAMINKLVTNEILVKKLMAQSAFISRLNAITISATQITSGYLSADRIRGGVISGIEVRGVTITGDSKIKIGEHGYMQPGERTLQINVPRYQHANYGVGMQVSGDKYGKVPKGVFIYDDPNFDRGDTINNANEVLLTVNGMIECCSLRDNNGVQKTGYPIVTIETFNEGNKGLYPIMNMYHQDKNGTFLLFSVPGTYFSVATNRQSDRRLKKNITNTHINALDLISKIQFKAFDWKEEKRGHEKLGVIAQELEIIEPNFISKINNPDNNEYTYELDHITLGMYNLKATQELNQKIIQLEQQIQQLRIRLSEVA